MAISLDGLVPNFRTKLEAVLATCASAGVEMRPYFGIRTPDEQAKLWRQSRAKEEIEVARQKLLAGGAPFLAEVLHRVGPQHGPHVTNALPGFSWHQWGEAMDCFWALNGHAEWSTTVLENGVNGYRFYANAGKAAGLTAGGLWTSFKDWPHLQLRSAASPVAAGMSMSDIDKEMKKRFA